jgi:hypothetical protein
MGAWGTDIFADDNAADLRDDYRKLIGDGVTGPQATDRLIAQWAPQGDPDLEPVFWLALAPPGSACQRRSLARDSGWIGHPAVGRWSR